jgi:hypothetical protein
MPGGSTLEVFQSAGADSLARATGLTLLEQDFESALAAIPSGYGEGVYEELRYGVTVRKSRDGKRTSLFARALAGGDVVSFNLYFADSSRTSPEVREVPILSAVIAARLLPGSLLTVLTIRSLPSGDTRSNGTDT